MAGFYIVLWCKSLALWCRRIGRRPGVYLLQQDNYTLSLEALASGETKGEDTIDGVPTDDTAVTSYFLGPQINFTWGSNVSMLVGADLPLSITSSGEQIVPTYRLRAAFSWRF
jgi:hypothetical protein